MKAEDDLITIRNWDMCHYCCVTAPPVDPGNSCHHVSVTRVPKKAKGSVLPMLCLRHEIFKPANTRCVCAV